MFKSILGLQKLYGGSVLADVEDVSGWDRRKYAQYFGYVPQSHTPPFPFTAFNVVLMGRTAHLGSYSSPSGNDRRIAGETMRALEIEHLRDRIYTHINGGERQMVLIARALAQQPKLLVMDEPTSSLDYGNQVRALSHIRALARQGLLRDAQHALALGPISARDLFPRVCRRAASARPDTGRKARRAFNGTAT